VCVKQKYRNIWLVTHRVVKQKKSGELCWR